MTLHIGRTIAWLAVALAVAGLAGPAAAQTPDEAQKAPPEALDAAAEPEATTGQIQPAPGQIQPAPVLTAARQPYWSSIGGFEVDSHETGYGFFGPQYIRPFRENVAFIGSANANYLFYEFDGPSGHTNVRSPGVNVMGGLMFGQRNWFALQAGPSFKRRHVEMVGADGLVMRSDRDLHTGFNLATSMWVDPTPHNNVFAMYNYETVDEYHWGRLAFKEQLANHSWGGSWTPYLGGEYIAQGNQDIRSHQFGPFFELVHVPSSVAVMVRGGYKRSSFDFGPNKTGPWFAIGFYHRLR